RRRKLERKGKDDDHEERKDQAGQQRLTRAQLDDGVLMHNGAKGAHVIFHSSQSSVVSSQFFIVTLKVPPCPSVVNRGATRAGSFRSRRGYPLTPDPSPSRGEGGYPPSGSLPPPLP